MERIKELKCLNDFQDITRAGGCSDKPSLVYFCVATHEIFTFNNGSLSLISLASESQPLSVKLELDAAITFAVTGVMANECATCIILYGPRGAATIAMGKKTRYQLQQVLDSLGEEAARATLPNVHVTLVSPLLFDSQPSLSVMQLRWHPLSVNHFGMLTSDSTLRIWNVGVGHVQHEQTLQLDCDGDVVQFEFGNAFGWSLFTVYYVLSDNCVYAQCPVVPYDCVIPSSILEELESHANERLNDLVKRVEHGNIPRGSRKFRKIHSQIKQWQMSTHWLEAVRGTQLIFQDEPWVQLNQPSNFRLVEPQLQGPLMECDIPDSERCCDMQLVAEEVPVFALMYQSGLIEIYVQISHIFPRWDGFQPVRSTTALGTFLLFDRTDVNPRIASIAGVDPKQVDSLHPRPFLVADPLDPKLWFVVHAGGVDLLIIPASLGAFLDALKEQSSIESTMRSVIVEPVVISKFMAEGLCGVTPVATKSGSYALLLARPQAGGVDLVDLIPVAEPEVARRKSIVVVSASEEKPQWLRSLHSLSLSMPPPGPANEGKYLSNLEGERQMEELLKVKGSLLKQSEMLKTGFRLLLESKRDLNQRSSAIARQVKKSAEDVEITLTRGAELPQRISMLQDNTANLTHRCKLLMTLLSSLRPKHSDAEKAMLSELKHIHSNFGRFSGEADSFQQFVEKHPNVFLEQKGDSTQAALTEALDAKDNSTQLQVISGYLFEQNQTISELTNLLQKVTTKANKLDLL